MKLSHLVLLPLCLLLLSPVSTAQEATKLKSEKKESAEISADKELEVQGLWMVEDKNDQGAGFLMGGSLDSIRISKDGTKYLIEVFADREGAYRTLAIREGDQLKIGQAFLGNIIFSDDGERAYFSGSEFRKVPDHKVRDMIEGRAEERLISECILNIRNIQQAVRGHSNMRNMNLGEGLDASEIHSKDGAAGYMKTPVCPGGGTYTYKDKVPKIGVLYCTCSLAHKGHVPKNHEDW